MHDPSVLGDRRIEQIHEQQPIVIVQIDFVSNGGTIAEWVPVAADGTFSYRHEHRPPEYAVVVSNEPLFLAALVDENASDLVLSSPATVIDLEVSIGEKSPQKDARVGLVIGGRYIPELAYAMHQSSRGLRPNLYNKGPLRIPAIAATGPLEVILGPPPDSLPPGIAAGQDVFTVPAYAAGLPRIVPTREGHVIF